MILGNMTRAWVTGFTLSMIAVNAVIWLEITIGARINPVSDIRSDLREWLLPGPDLPVLRAPPGAVPEIAPGAKAAVLIVKERSYGDVFLKDGAVIAVCAAYPDGSFAMGAVRVGNLRLVAEDDPVKRFLATSEALRTVGSCRKAVRGN